ncbi:MAG: HD domain-containing protein [Tenericutes bacterium]|jgi:HD-GYP domain-containing protein (c-di-GMP phosphodiesterase class II)|nr:HD domain-containing protein [Mycoplasmatota bacterium]
MLKKLLIGTVLLSVISLIITILVMFMTYNQGTEVFEKEEKLRKEESVEFFINDMYSELMILTRAHAYWTFANDAVKTDDLDWVSINLTQYLSEEDFEIDALLIVKEDETIVDSFGFDETVIENTNLYERILNDNTQENSLLWIDGELFIFAGMPLANDDATDKNGVFLLGKTITGQLLDYLISIVEPESIENFHLYADESEFSSEPQNFTITIPSIDDSLIIETRLTYTLANYIKEHLIINTILIVTSLFVINSAIYFIATLIAAKHRKILIQGMDSIHLSNHNFPRIPKNKIIEFDLIGQKVNSMLDRIELNYEQLSKKNIEIVQLLSRANEINDLYTREHSDYVSKICGVIGEKLNVSNIDELLLSAQLHDVGKVFIPLTILNKKGKLTEDEFNEIKKHPKYGYSILDGISNFDHINEGVLYHHEKYNGGGYPEGLKGKEIPLFARIIAVADVFEALTADRPYRDAYLKEEALNIMKKQKEQYDPEIFKIFLDNIEEE